MIFKFIIQKEISNFEIWNKSLKTSVWRCHSERHPPLQFLTSVFRLSKRPSATSQTASPWRQQVAIFSFLCAKIEILFTSSSLRLCLQLRFLNARVDLRILLASSSSSGNETIANMQEEEEEEENQNVPDQEEDE